KFQYINNLKFQNDFWLKQHQWYTIYESNEKYAVIATTPYSSNEFKLTLDTNIAPNPVITYTNLFKKVTHLKLFIEAVKKLSDKYFPNVRLLTLAYSKFNIEDLESIKTSVNLSNLNFLGIERGYTLDSPSIILEIIKQAPKLSAIAIPTEFFLSFFDNNDSCLFKSND
ncbi:unnamed protein product, partial [Rotaria sp. Silwood1]